jgi:hypothetical protein
MPEPIVAVQYFLFMKWFKSAHADLYRKYSLHVIVPISSYKIEIAIDYIDPADRKFMKDALREYYTTKAD